MKDNNPFPFAGLSQAETIAARLQYGTNKLERSKTSEFWRALQGIFLEPIFLLLIACAAIYFFVNAVAEAWFMLGAVIPVAVISLYQHLRSRRALEACRHLRNLKQPLSR